MKLIHWGIVIITGLAIIVIALVLHKKSDEKMLTISTPNLLEHSVYSKYEFDNSKGQIIRVGIQPLYLPTSLIMEAFKRDTILKDALSNMGLEIRFYNFLKGDDINFFLRRGDLDAGIGGDMPTITAAATIDIVIPAIIQRGFTSIVANRYMLIDNLRGRRIGYAFGSNAHYALLKTLASADIEENQVELIRMEVTQMPEALQAGNITAFSAWEPTPSLAQKYTESTVIHQRLSLGFFYFLETFYHKHPEALSYIIAAEIRSIQWMRKKRQNLLRACSWNIASAQLAFGTKIRLSTDEIAAIALKDILGQSSNPGITADNLKENGPLHQELKFLIDIEKVPASVSWVQVRKKFRPDILNDIWSNKDKLRLDEFKYTDSENIH